MSLIGCYVRAKIQNRAENNQCQYSVLCRYIPVSKLSCVRHEFYFRQEISVLRTKSVLLSAVGALEYTSGAMATLVSVITLVLTGHPITPVNVFMLLSFNNVLRLSFSFYVAVGLLEIAEAYSSLNRIENFLLLDNLSLRSCGQTIRDMHDKMTVSARESIDHDSIDTQSDGWNDSIKDAIGEKPSSVKPRVVLRVTNLTCKQFNRDDYILQDIEVLATTKSLTVITGPVGSGKSTLLSVIAGEVSDTGGKVTFQGTLVYVPQMAWIFSGTIRANILFGKPYDEAKYTRIIETCALTEDIQQFPDSDETVVGECGAVLSGGQRARVSLARAVYADADLYLLDDPLSAVDFKVGQHIFEKCIKGLLCDKTRVLASHQEQHMRNADEVIVLCKGRVLGKGSFTELQEKGILNETVDPLLKKIPTESKLDESLVAENQDRQWTDGGDGAEVLSSQAKGLIIPREDRAIGVVSSKLYWDYFRSGVALLLICAGICFCFITQGKPLSWPRNLTLYKYINKGEGGYWILEKRGW